MTPTRDQLIDAWIELEGDLKALATRFSLSPRQLRDFAADPVARRELDAWSDLVERGARLRALSAQSAAAHALHDSLSKLESPTERRRAATTLARIARDMLKPPPRRPPLEDLESPPHASMPDAPMPSPSSAPPRPAHTTTPHPTSHPKHQAS